MDKLNVKTLMEKLAMITDDDLLQFNVIEVSDDFLDEIGFPTFKSTFTNKQVDKFFLPNVELPVEWKDAFKDAYNEDLQMRSPTLDAQEYHSFSELKKKFYREKMKESVNRARRLNWFRKCCFFGVFGEKLVSEDDDPLVAVGVSPYQRGLRAASSLNFPKFWDTDEIPYYEKPFSLHSWLENHGPDDTRWCDAYSNWSSKYNLLNGHKLKKESLAIVQSLIIAVLDFWDSKGAHGLLLDPKTYILTQYFEGDGGVKKVGFRTQLIDNKNQSQKLVFSTDRKEFGSILRRIFMGKQYDNEIDLMFRLLDDYKTSHYYDLSMLLRDFPGLWDSYKKKSFYMTLYEQQSDQPAFLTLSSVYTHARHYAKTFRLSGGFRDAFYWENWLAKLPHDSLLGDVFYQVNDKRSSSSQPTPIYNDYSIEHMVKFARHYFVHSRDKIRAVNMDVRCVEILLSDLFSELPVAIYHGMCKEKHFYY